MGNCTSSISIPIAPRYSWNEEESLMKMRHYWSGYNMMWSKYWHYGIFVENQTLQFCDLEEDAFLKAQERTLDLIASNFHLDREDPVIVEQGCGLGSNIAYLSRKFQDGKFVGMDIDRINVRHASEIYRSLENCMFLVQSISETCSSVQDNSVDAVFSVEVLCALKLEAKRKAFLEAFRMLRYGGSLVFTDVMRLDCQADHSHSRACSDIKAEDLQFMKEFYGMIGFEAEVVCCKSLCRLAEECGFILKREIDLSHDLPTNYEFACSRTSGWNAPEISRIISVQQHQAFMRHYQNAREFFSAPRCSTGWKLIVLTKELEGLNLSNSQYGGQVA
jgi:cyclopropane fatty-acyl-phospholipid synthase-like methyltransferase